MLNDEIRDKLFELQDIGYRDFNRRLIPTVAGEAFVGIHMV